MDDALIESQRLAESEIVDVLLEKWKGSENFKRVEAFDVLDGERRYQEELHLRLRQEKLSIPGELALLKVYLDKAFAAYAATFGDSGEKPTMDVIRKIGGICLRCMENYGAIKRPIKVK